MTFTSDCPKVLPQTGPIGIVGIAACDESGFVLAGVDLGHGDSGTVDMTVSMNGGSPISARATLQSIANTRDCSVICFQHAGMLAN
jgi:hypothetical protein